jgi:membrane complex biogenesis BtpA family protein
VTVALEFPALVGVIHLPPLPGSPGAEGLGPSECARKAVRQAVHEAKVLTDAGFEGLMIENFGDAPFFKTAVPPETIAAMTAVAAAVRAAVEIPVGVNVLRNDAHAALAIASVAGCEYVRVNVLSGVVATDQGLIEGDAANLIRRRAALGSSVAILADVHVKHARSLSSDSLTLAIEETAHRGGADAIIVTGATTGRLMDLERLREASQTARAQHVPLYIGSGANAANLPQILPHLEGVIVGSDLRWNGKAGAPLDADRIAKFVAAWRAARQ